MNVTSICSIQQARIAAFHMQLLTTITRFTAAEDVEIRVKTPHQQRLTWDKFILDYQNKPLLRRHLRMTYSSFCRLVERIRPLIEVDDDMASLRGGKIIPEIHLYCTLRYLAGGSYSDICIFCGISVTSFYAVLRRTMNAINSTLEIEFPSTKEHCVRIAEGFENVSHRGVFKNCVGAVDGYLLSIMTPRKAEAKNVRSYFSGHYQRYGLNIQACCDADCRFTFLGIGGPGVTKDRQGVKESGLYKKVQALPKGYICVADCAYIAPEKMIPTFGGDLALKRDNDHFNFYLSQLRIRIEMAFGLMTKKWGILQCPLTNSLVSIKHLICCIARLHNFCIDERLAASTSASSSTSTSAASPASTATLASSPATATLLAPTTVPTTTVGFDSLATNILAEMTEAAEQENREILSKEYLQWSLTREAMVSHIKQLGLKRPVANRLKRKRKTVASLRGSLDVPAPGQSQLVVIA